MNDLSIEEFVDFIKSYKKYYLPITEISAPKKNNKVDKENALVKNDNFFMYSLDDMCKSVDKFKNRPTSMDALYYKIHEDNFSLYLIEFKGHNFEEIKTKDTMVDNIDSVISNISNKSEVSKQDIRDLENFRKYYVNKEIGLNSRLKIFESLFIVLPVLYEEYCKNNNIKIKNIKKFLNDSVTNVFFVSRDFNDPKNKRNNKSKNHINYLRFNGKRGSIGFNIKLQCERMMMVNLISKFSIFKNSFFDYFLKIELEN